MKKIYKIGQNKGEKRLWLEGAILKAAGFHPGDRYNFEYGGDGIYYLRAAPDGLRKVSGKGEKPIIDIMNQTQLSGFEVGDRVYCLTLRGVIAIYGDGRRLGGMAVGGAE